MPGHSPMQFGTQISFMAGRKNQSVCTTAKNITDKIDVIIDQKDISPTQRKVLDEFISQVEHKRCGAAIDEEAKNALNNKQVMNCNGIRQIDQERKK